MFGQNAELVVQTGHVSSVNSVAFSPDGKLLASGGSDSAVKLWDVATGQELKTFGAKNTSVASVVFSRDGRILAAACGDHTIRLWDIFAGRQVRTLAGHAAYVYSIALSPDGKTLASGSGDKTIKLWDVATFQLLKTLPGAKAGGRVAFSADGTTLASGDSETVKLLDIATGGVRRSLPATAPDTFREVYGVAPNFYRNRAEPITADDRFQFRRGANGRLDLYEFKTGKLSASLIALGENDWAVITPEGLFDASAGARHLMHYAVGVEPISLEQMKGTYYIPGLSKKILGGEPLPKVGLFSSRDLFPLAEFMRPKADQKSFNVRLRNRGGGIGQVQVFVNGKEFIGDARPVRFNPDRAEATLRVNLGGAPLVAGKENKIEVVTYNAAGSLNSRGSARGAELMQVFSYGEQPKEPHLYAIVGGVQRPLVIAPDASGSFDIGKFTADEQKLISLSVPKPLILRPSLQNKDLDYDDLDLEGALRQELRNVSFAYGPGQGNAPLVFVEADEMVDAIRPSGSYTVGGDNIQVTLRLIRNMTPFKTLTFNGKVSRKQQLVKEMVAAVSRANADAK